MEIRRAKKCDINGINDLLHQVLEVHHNGRPDIFKGNVKKYTDDELCKILENDKTPVFVALDENGNVLGHTFCEIIQHKNNNILTDIKTLYIDDLCINERYRKQHIGTALYEYVLNYAKSIGCYNITLNVWACNENAQKFYEHCGFVPQKTTLEKLL